MAQKIKSYACHSPKGRLVEEFYEPLPLKEHDVHIKIVASGCCHSDAHSVDGDWGKQNYPLVPGHEIIGYVSEVGSAVTKFKVGDRAGVGVIVNSCKKCEKCLAGEEPLCANAVFTYGQMIGEYVTRGGYAEEIRVNQEFVYRIPDNLKSEDAAPLLCAGITTYAPFHYFKVTKGQKVGIVGIGGLGHIAVQFAAALGCEVTAISSSSSKEALAKSFGAHHYINSSDEQAVKNAKESFDFILNTVSADIDTDYYLQMVKSDGIFCFVGIPPNGIKLEWFKHLKRRVLVTGSLIGGCDLTQKMLDFSAQHNVKAMVETLPMNEDNVNLALEKLRKNSAKFRTVLVRELTQ